MGQFVIGLREMHRIGLFLYDTHDPKSPQDSLGLARLLIREAAAEYRTHNGPDGRGHGHLRLGGR